MLNKVTGYQDLVPLVVMESSKNKGEISDIEIVDMLKQTTK